MQAPGGRVDQRRQRVDVRPLELGQRPIIDDLGRHGVDRGQLLERVGVGRGPRLGAPADRQAQLAEQDLGELLIGGDVEGATGQRVDLRLERRQRPAHLDADLAQLVGVEHDAAALDLGQHIGQRQLHRSVQRIEARRDQLGPLRRRQCQRRRGLGAEPRAHLFDREIGARSGRGAGPHPGPAPRRPADTLGGRHHVQIVAGPRGVEEIRRQHRIRSDPRQRGITLAGVGSDSMLAAYLLDASRTRYDLDVVAATEGVGRPAGRGTWMGTGASARPGADLSVEEVGARLGPEAAAALALAAPQGAKLIAAGLDTLYRTMELPLADVLAKIESRGIMLDTDKLREIGVEVGGSLAALESEIHALAGGPFNIASNKQLAEVLFGKLGLPVGRRTKTGPSTDADTLEELASIHPVPAKIVDYRTLAKLKGTYIDALPALVNPTTGRLHTSFNQAVAATGRLSSSNPNLENIPIRTELGRRIREAFVAKPGHLLVSADYSQIELRILAHFSQDPAFLDAFRSGQDIHLRTAAEVFGVSPESVTGEHRRIAKAINCGLVFGQSDFGLAQVLRIPRAQARLYIESYFTRYAGVRAYMERAIVEARASAAVSTLLGRRRPLPEIRATRAQDRAYAERIARNTPIQGSAADLLKLAMIRIEHAIEAGRAPVSGAALLLTVHDELVFEVPAAGAEELKRWVKNEMETVYELAVPLVVDVGAGWFCRFGRWPWVVATDRFRPCRQPAVPPRSPRRR